MIIYYNSIPHNTFNAVDNNNNSNLSNLSDLNDLNDFESFNAEMLRTVPLD